MNTDEASIVSVLERYIAAFNAGNIESVMQMYASDAVFMPQASSSQIGLAAIESPFRRMFNTRKLHIQFDIAEIVQAAPAWAFVRINSFGRQRILESGSMTVERNQDLIVMQHITGNGELRAIAFQVRSALPPDGDLERLGPGPRFNYRVEGCLRELS
jgi:uncharacterized protein (TIGR02246 family)